MGLFGATGVGVGAIVGGGILALAGAAFQATGPAAIVAFLLNGVIATLTALSFAEMSSRFPESGGTYTFSRKVLSVESAFTVGWVVWFASILAALLYALGFAHFMVILTQEVLLLVGRTPPDWLSATHTVPIIALIATLGIALFQIWKTSGAGSWANIAKVVVFAVLILGGLWAVTKQPIEETQSALQPFFASGWQGLLQAMGYSFIALQGFDLIAAVGGDVRDAKKTVPKAMLLSLAIALAIYLPLLFVIATVGTSDGMTIQSAADSDPESIVANAAKEYLGAAGYWLVILAAVLSMFTALQANIYAASRIAFAMANDHTLPSILGKQHATRNTPAPAIAITAAIIVLFIWLLPDVSAAGAASSLIFLMTFAIAHWLSVLIRLRSMRNPPPFRTSAFPLIPITGGIACLCLAVFQGFAVPQAGTIAVVWLGIGGILFLSLFARRARLMDISATASQPELLALRGQAPLVLVPIANPSNAHAMISLADILVPADIGRVLLQTVVVAPQDWDADKNIQPIERSQRVLRELLQVSSRIGIRAETITSVAAKPMQEIARVAQLHRCESVLLGLSDLEHHVEGETAPIERLLSTLESEVVILRAPENWQLRDAKRILVPVAGRGGHDRLLARLLGSLAREHQREVVFQRVVPSGVTAKEHARVTKDLQRLAKDNLRGPCELIVQRSNDPIAAIAQQAESCSLLVLGIQRLGPKEKLFGRFTRQLARSTSCPIIILSRRG